MTLPSMPAAARAGAVLVAALVVLVAPARAFETTASHLLLVDHATGTVLAEKQAGDRMVPASMSKLMTAFILFERLDSGALSLDDTFRVSVDAWQRGGAASGGSTMFLDPNSDVTVADLLRGIIVQSGNDACIVAAENLAGTEAAFAAEMNATAQRLGLDDSTFANATGLPDPNQRMSPRDLATLAGEIIDRFPEYYSIYSERSFTYNEAPDGTPITQSNRNPLLGRVDGADGLKTGHLSESGYGLVGSAERDGRRLILVINGLESARARAEEAARVLEWGFRSFQNLNLFEAGETVVPAQIWLGTEPEVPLVTDRPVTITVPRQARSTMVVKALLDEPVPAPVSRNQPLGRLVVEVPDMDRLEVPLYAGADVARLGFIARLQSAARHLVLGHAH